MANYNKLFNFRNRVQVVLPEEVKLTIITELKGVK